ATSWCQHRMPCRRRETSLSCPVPAARIQRLPSARTGQPPPMNESNGYAVFFFPQALEALGDAIRPYLQEGAAGAHVLCNEIDTGGALVEMTLQGRDSENREVALELMVPTSMVRMIVSTRSDESF